ncbi:uncharacterized protein J7T54_008104 [Emericellopsis cladophorae]|uniref:Calcineurin-like phosphoesterase domain-containing protein n=1 Tax=Emericellopsis cladophorae TaxID=2686198 RepID=A0A9P9Y8M7_9HYPO|nr:uncharacterized protein J7T54_008104 [Emericellopsis cladophorae]KAI6785010.1 hypothetical protein J7T54_008104 [Emericellopsis cladophorae]
MESFKIPTKLLILSDAHADPEIIPSGTLSLLAQIDAPLKLIIPGNHDFTLDDGAFAMIRTESLRLNDGRLDEKSLDDAYGRVVQAQGILMGDGIRLLLEEGTYTFTPGNGARLTVFASPFTPSKNNIWKDRAESTRTEDLNHYTCIDNDKSQVIESIATLRPTKFDDDGAIRAKGEREQAYHFKRAVRATGVHESEFGSSSSTLLADVPKYDIITSCKDTKGWCGTKIDGKGY